MIRLVPWRRTAVILGGTIVVVVIAAVALSRHVGDPAYLERRLSREIGTGYTVHIESSHYDLLQRTFSATGVTVIPDTLEHTTGRARRRTLSWVAVDAVHADGVNLWDLQRGVVNVDDVRAEGLKIRVLLDRRIPSRYQGLRRLLPHEALNSSDKSVRFGTIRVVRGDIRYSEHGILSSRPGTIRFADFYATVTNLRNDNRAQPCVIDVRTRFANSGLLNATFKYDLSSDSLKMDYRLAMKEMDATALNPLLVDLKGIRIERGTIDSLSADISVRNGVAVGSIRLPYHGLKFEVLDRDSHDRDLKDKLKTFMFSRSVEDSNPDEDEPVRVINVRLRRGPSVSLIKFVWQTVREGTLRTVGIDPAQNS
ncbi:MAG TPA: DUF748 domain-containing protein [Candidatus Krumholzibacteria bacterium]